MNVCGRQSIFWTDCVRAGRRRELFRKEQRVIFERRPGPSREAGRTDEAATQTPARGGREFTELLHRNGPFDDAWVVLTLANHAERLAARG